MYSNFDYVARPRRRARFSNLDAAVRPRGERERTDRAIRFGSVRFGSVRFDRDGSAIGRARRAGLIWFA